MRQKWNRAMDRCGRLLVIAVMGLGALGVASIPTTTVQASHSASNCIGPFPGGRACFDGYFYGVQYDGGSFGNLHDVQPGGVPGWVVDIPSFEAWILGLNDAGDAQGRTAAHYIMSTMLGGGYTAGHTWDRAAWIDLIEHFNGSAQFNVPYFFACGTVNTGYQSPADAPIPGDGDITAWNDFSAADGCGGNVQVIRFLSANGSEYLVKIECANPIGGMGALQRQPLDYTNTPSVTSGTTRVRAGQTTNVQFLGYVNSTGAGTAGPYTVGETTGPFASVTAPLTPGPWDWGVNGIHGPHWYNYNISPPANTVDGTLVCTTFSVTPHSYTDPNPASASYCLTVVNPAYPQLIGNNGDVHSGGGLCTGGAAPSGIGTVRGNAYSYGQYVVSSAGVISNFGSNNNPALKSASLNAYSQVCRPDLVKAASDYIADGGAYTSLGATVNASSLNGGGPGQNVFYRAGDLVLNGGNITKSVTLVVTGNLTITGNITLNGSKVASDQPGLGIIAGSTTANVVKINSTATQVDAYIFSNGTIQTCPNIALCHASLQVNGFLIANQISFQRLGPVLTTGGTVPAETVTLLPQLYSNPPLLFSGGINESLLLDLGERPPLY